jgi:hypothetical protein
MYVKRLKQQRKEILEELETEEERQKHIQEWKEHGKETSADYYGKKLVLVSTVRN